MKTYLKIILFLLMPRLCNAQNIYVDSLLNVSINGASDSVRYISLIFLSNYFDEKDREKSLDFLDQGLLLSQKNNKKLDIASCLDQKGYILNKNNKYAEALQCYLTAFLIAEDPTNNRISWFNDDKTSPDSLRLDILSSLNNGFANLMRSTGNNEKAIFYYRKIENPDGTGNFICDMNIGSVYNDMNKLDSALFYEKKAEESSMQMDSRYYRPNIFRCLADIYFKQGDKSLAKLYYYKGLELANEVENLSALVSNEVGITKYYLLEKQKDSSLFYARKAIDGLNILKSNPVKGIHIGILYENLYLAYQLNNKQDSTFKYLRLAMYAKDSINAIMITSLSAFQNLSINEQQRLQQLEKEKLSYQSKLRTNILLGCIVALLIFAFFLFMNNRNKQKAKRKIEQAYTQLKSTQAQLIQSEKMASLGELTAGIAHEIQNPLNFVNNFSEVNKELLTEMKDEMSKGNLEDATAIANDVIENSEKINHHGKRAGNIVKGMLQHSRTSTGKKELTDINALCDEYLRLSYHGLRAKQKDFNADFKTEFDETIGKINIVPQDIGRVILNLINNAFYAVNEKKKTANEHYEPIVSINTKKINGNVEIKVADNGNGIPQKIVDKIFQPFFTTKPTGQGTGLGLSLSYDIVKAHGGEIKVESKEGEGSEFIIQLTTDH